VKKSAVILSFFFSGLVSAQNLLWNSGFDTGVYALWKSAYQDGRLVDDNDLDFQVFHDGLCSLRLTTWEGNYPWSGYQISTESTFPVEGEGQSYTVSAWVKSDRKITFSLILGGLKIQSQVLPEEGWKKVTATGNLSGKNSLILQASGLEFDSEQLHAGHLWVDSLQLEKGLTTGGWRPAAAEIGLICLPPAHIYYAGEPVEILLVAGHPYPETATFRYSLRLRDCFGQLVWSKENQILTVEAGKYQKKLLSFPSEKKGIFRLEIEGEAISRTKAEKFRREVPFYVVLPPEPGNWNPYGLYLQMTVPAMERASRLGLYWNNLLSSAGAITEWNKVYYQDSFLGEKFLPRLKAGKERYHLRYIGNIASSSFPAPSKAWSEKEIPGETLTLPEEKKQGFRYLKLSAYREYLENSGKFYSPYINFWQIIDETNFRGKVYLSLVEEAVRILKKHNPEAKILATYPQNMAYVYLRGGKELVDGLYDLGRENKRAVYAAKAAEIASAYFPVFFYDCSLPFNYFSTSFHGWGKSVTLSQETLTGKEAEKAQEEFRQRLNEVLCRNLAPLAAGVHATAICLYHARLPGGKAQSAFDTWGHPAAELIIFSTLNSLFGKGKSLGVISGKLMEGYWCATGGNKYLAIVRPVSDFSGKGIQLPENLALKQLDFFGNDVTEKRNGKSWIVFSPFSFTLIQASSISEKQMQAFLQQ